jgi:UDP-N-acetylglucosamine:LPS N-acetylglucosamine transferase
LQKDVTEETLFAELAGLLTDAERRAAMGGRARLLARPGALERIVAIVLRVAERV